MWLLHDKKVLYALLEHTGQEPAFLYLVFTQQEPDCGVTLSLHPHMPSCHFLNDFFQTVWDLVWLFPQKFLSDFIPRKKVKGKTALSVDRKKESLLLSVLNF